MFNFLKEHPFPVEAFFESSLVLTYAVEKRELEKFLPECLELDTFNNEWAFVAAAMVQTKGLRPKGFPVLFGNNFFLIGYRIFVRYTNAAGKRLRGLFILRSETDKKLMARLGNIFTHYNYIHTDIAYAKKDSSIIISSGASGISIEAEVDKSAELPPKSPFSSWKEARRFAGPLPFTFTYDILKKEVLIIEGVRENWVPLPVLVKHADISFIKKLAPAGILASAFIITDIPYHWKKGKMEQWKT